MNRIKNNINNLINLWATVSKPTNGYGSDGSISYSKVTGSEWPNKIWLNQTITTNALSHTKELIEKSNNNLRFVDFEFDGETNEKLIESSGYKLTSTLPGMHLQLTKTFPDTVKLNFELVTTEVEAKIWCEIFKQSFGYLISEDLVIKSMHRVSYYIAFYNNAPVGTIKLHLTNETAGIYSLGVPSSMRGNGFAKEIMYFILNKAIKLGATVAVLQASALAQGMYERLGFKKDFTMNSYELKTQ